MTRSKRGAALLILGSAIAAWAGTANADTYKFVGAGGTGPNGNWTDPSAWQDTTNAANTGVYYPGNTGGTPASDGANIDNGGTVTIDGTMTIGSPSPAKGANPIQVADTAASTATLNMTGGTLYTVSDIRLGGVGTAGSTANGTFNQSGGTAYMIGGNVNIGYGGTGTYNLSGGLLEMQSSTPLFVVGNRAANGNAIVNQTGGTVYLQVVAANDGVQIGRQSNGAGTYNMSGGTLLTGNLLFGSAAAAGFNDTFNLSGSGRVVTNNIVVNNTAGTTAFNMTGGRLSANSVAISITNDGGTLDPATATFATTGTSGADPNALPINPIGMTTFTGTTNYTQTAKGALAIDLAGDSSYDQVTLTSGAATIGGTIAVDTLNGYDPAIGTTYDIVTTGSTSVPVIDTAIVTGTTPSGNTFLATPTTNGSGNEVLRLTVVAAAATPEPASLGLFAAGAVALLARRRHRR